MLRNFDRPITDIGGEVMLKNDKPVPLRVSIAEALVGNYPDEHTLTFQEKEDRYTLARKVIKGGTQEYDIDELKQIKTLCGKGLVALVVGQVSEALKDEISSAETPA